VTGRPLKLEVVEQDPEDPIQKKPSKGAPPLSLSQPFSLDRSRSSSPAKASQIPLLPASRDSSPLKTPQILPSTWSLGTTFNKFINPNDPSAEDHRSRNFSQRGRPEGRGRAAAFKHHQFLPHATTITSPTLSSFQPQLSASDPQTASSSYRVFEFKTSAPVSPTTKVNIAREILTSPSISQHVNVTLLPSIVEQNITESSPSDTTMSSTVETMSSGTFHPRSERGYNNSLMAQLMCQYKADANDDDTSTWQ